MIWVWPPPSNSHHHDYHIFSTESRHKPYTVAILPDLPHSKKVGIPTQQDTKTGRSELSWVGAGSAMKRTIQLDPFTTCDIWAMKKKQSLLRLYIMEIQGCAPPQALWKGMMVLNNPLLRPFFLGVLRGCLGCIQSGKLTWLMENGPGLSRCISYWKWGYSSQLC